MGKDTRRERMDKAEVSIQQHGRLQRGESGFALGNPPPRPGRFLIGSSERPPMDVDDDDPNDHENPQ